ncbi:Rho-binding antiterminator [Candidatus Methylomicrobium oryzae]|jgi:Rho-binding antiterminator|uniref:Rho-binding antiterminator n=1 Tax=Candidatus Methylomicrobium oryzae TaxID=2802053 RepID=UPI00192250D0|nr:Rho-binding antiterminator [Methylomicrobium sp. RS1]MBL1262308.1 Rho-binding antiterminator [Methylomicrobium sp. RS1]
MTEHIISCDLHDYIEVACMHNYRVELVLKGGEVIEGKALDVLTSPEKREFLVIDNGGQKQQVELTELHKMIALTPNASFNEVEFKARSQGG